MCSCLSNDESVIRFIIRVMYIYTCICIKLNAIINAIAETAVCNDSVYLDICVFSYLDNIPDSVFHCADKFV